MKSRVRENQPSQLRGAKFDDVSLKLYFGPSHRKIRVSRAPSGTKNGKNGHNFPLFIAPCIAGAAAVFCTGRVQKSFVIRDCGARFRGLQIGVIRGFGCYGRAPASWDWGDGVPRSPLHLWRRGCSRLHERAWIVGARSGPSLRPFSTDVT